MVWQSNDVAAMRRALELAGRGRGFVEPNPPVAAVVADVTGRILSEGWHARYGGPHAEILALRAAGAAARGATLYVTLEPCSHHGKTPPCTEAILAAGVHRVVIGCEDPFPAVAGSGVRMLQAAGLDVQVGLLADEARRLIAAFHRLVVDRRPWVIAKWAMTMEGLMASPPGADRWISSPASRRLVHEIRGRMDAIVVGIGTVLADDPLLTPRPPGPRMPLRVVLDRRARLPLGTKLVATARETPVLVAVGPEAEPARIQALEGAGCEVWKSVATESKRMLCDLLDELGRRSCTNLLLEAGPELLQGFLAADLVDEVWLFVAPAMHSRAVDATASLPRGPDFDLDRLLVEEIKQSGGDVLIRGLVRRPRSFVEAAAPSSQGSETGIDLPLS